MNKPSVSVRISLKLFQEYEETEAKIKADRTTLLVMAEGLVKGLELACAEMGAKLQFSNPAMGVTLCVYQNGDRIRSGYAVLSKHDSDAGQGSVILGYAIAALRAMDKPVPNIFLGE